MAFTAAIVNKGIVDKSFQVAVSYTNGGGVQFVETIDMTGGTLDALAQRIQSRIAGLNATETLIPQVPFGAFSTVPSTPANATFIAAVKHFNSCQRAVTLGLIQNTDPIFTNAQNAMVSAYDPSFIDSL